jgi:hypothetical protein
MCLSDEVQKAYLSHILVYNWLVRAPAHQELYLFKSVQAIFIRLFITKQNRTLSGCFINSSTYEN